MEVIETDLCTHGPNVRSGGKYKVEVIETDLCTHGPNVRSGGKYKVEVIETDMGQMLGQVVNTK